MSRFVQIYPTNTRFNWDAKYYLAEPPPNIDIEYSPICEIWTKLQETNPLVQSLALSDFRELYPSDVTSLLNSLFPTGERGFWVGKHAGLYLPGHEVYIAFARVQANCSQDEWEGALAEFSRNYVPQYFSLNLTDYAQV